MKNFQQYHNENRQQILQKIKEFLKSKGYTENFIATVLDNIIDIKPISISQKLKTLAVPRPDYIDIIAYINDK